MGGGNTQAERAWFVIDLSKPSEERAPVWSGGCESTAASPFVIPNTLIEGERERGVCCGCCGCFAECCSRKEEVLVGEDFERGIRGAPILGAVAFVIVLVSVVLLVMFVWSLDGYEGGDESGSGGFILDMYGSGNAL